MATEEPIGELVERPRDLLATIEAMYAEYMADECCDYTVINALIEVAHEQAAETASTLSRLQAELEAVKGALEPFGALADKWSSDLPDDKRMAVSRFNEGTFRRQERVGLKLGHFRRAATLCGKAPA
jgi:hypothetical protein